MANNDNIVFPDSYQTSPKVPDINDITTTSTLGPEPESDEALIAVIVTLVIVVVGFIVMVIGLKYRRDAAAAKTKLMEEGHPQISLPTLGTQYELNSLLSLNTLGRKDSRQSEFSVASAAPEKQILDIRVSKYIDGGGEDTVDASDNNNDTLETILNNTNETLNNTNTTENHEERDNTNKLIDIKVEDCSAPAPGLQILPPSPAPDKERPKSDYFGSIPPILPAKKTLGHAASEMSLLVTRNQNNSHVVGKSDSNIHTNVPNLPPKLTPLLPPKQMINKSREDVNKINKDIMRKSSQQIFIKGLNPPKKKDDTDIDYDFPSNNKDDHEYEEYDEPQPVAIDKAEEEEEIIDDRDIDYDDPVQRYS